MQLKWAVIKYLPASLSLIRIRCFSLSCFVHFHWSLCMYLSPLLALDFCYIILLLATWAATGWISGFCLYNGLLDLWLHLNKVPFECTLSLHSRQHPTKGTPIYDNQAFKFRHHEKFYYVPLAANWLSFKSRLEIYNGQIKRRSFVNCMKIYITIMTEIIIVTYTEFQVQKADLINSSLNSPVSGRFIWISANKMARTMMLNGCKAGQRWQ